MKTKGNRGDLVGGPLWWVAVASFIRILDTTRWKNNKKKKKDQYFIPHSVHASRFFVTLSHLLPASLLSH